MSVSITRNDMSRAAQEGVVTWEVGKRGMDEPLQMAPPHSCAAEIDEPLQEGPIVAPPDPALPQVTIPGGAVSITESAKKLYGCIAPAKRLFIKSGKVTHLATDDNGSMFFDVVTPTAACSLFEKFIEFRETKRGQPRWAQENERTNISKELADKYLQCEERKLLPVVRGVLNCPVITERDGAIHVVDNGYDPETGLYVNSPGSLPIVDLAEAKEMLPLLLQDFDFQTPGDRSRAIAELITPALKFGGFLKDCIPISVAEADKSQSGKSYRQQMTAALYNEELKTVVKKDGGGTGSFEEALATNLAEGRPFVQIDNVRGKMNSQFLEAFLTTKGTILARPAYSKQVPIDPSRHFLFINSNGYQATKDLTNRSVIVRIKKRENYDFQDMLTLIKGQQPYLLALVFEVIKEWYRQGKPRTNERGHDFREWCQILDWIVQNIFDERPLMEGHSDALNRASSPSHSFARETSLMLQERNFLNHELQAGEIANLCRGSAINIPFLSHDLRDDDDARRMAVGKAMAELYEDEMNQAQIEGFTITREVTRVVGEAGKAYDRKTYTFRAAR